MSDTKIHMNTEHRKITMLQLQSQEVEVGWWEKEREQSVLALENQHSNNELTGCKGYNTYMNMIG